MRIILLSIALVLSIESTSLAADCARLLKEFESIGKSISLSKSERSNGTDEIISQMRISNMLANRQMNLTLMINGKCQLPEGPITNNEYASSARACRAAAIKNLAANQPECDMTKWTKDPYD